MMNIRKILVINPLTLFVVVLFLYSGFKSDLLLVILVFAIHEIGHIFFSFIFKVKIVRIDIYPFGGVIKLDKKINFSIFKNILISSGGIIFQLLFELINIYFFKNNKLSFYNMLLLKINLLPISPFDGNKIFEYIIMLVFPYVYALIIGKVVGTITIIFYLYMSILNNNLNFILVILMIKNLYQEIKLIPSNKMRFLLERYLNNFAYKKRIKYHKINVNLIRLNRYALFGDINVQSEREILGKMFDKQAYF